MMGGAMSITHWLVVLGVVVLVFGTGKLRTLGKDLGEGLRSMRHGMREVADAKRETEQQALQIKREVER